eukprot:m.47027 g.47027  ORF g.47027 m.47027 type:complete len:296 (+) comp33756_c0_seq5:199-1086(+)
MGVICSIFSIFSNILKDWAIQNRRQNVISNFKKQTFILLGLAGAGKSSLINSFNYVINLHGDSDTQWEEVAAVGAGSRQQTKKVKKYDGTCGMYSRLDYEDQGKAPGFIDLIGLPNQEFLSELMQCVVNGKIPDDTLLQDAIKKEDDDYRENLMRAHQEIKPEMAAWTILFIVSAKAALPDSLAKDVLAAVERVNTADGEDDKKRRAEIRVYVIVTKLDKLNPQKFRQDKLKEITRWAEQHLNVKSNRVFPVNNFTSDTDMVGGRWIPDRDKQQLTLRAFEILLTPTHSIDPFDH